MMEDRVEDRRTVMFRDASFWNSPGRASRFHLPRGEDDRGPFGHLVAVCNKRIQLDDGHTMLTSMCGARVYKTPITEWAKQRFDKGLDRCKHCERVIRKSEAADMQDNAETGGGEEIVATGKERTVNVTETIDSWRHEQNILNPFHVETDKDELSH